MKFYVCAVCEIEKPETEFYERKDRKKGRIGRCKECEGKRAKRVRETRQATFEGRENDRKIDKARNKIRYAEAKRIRDDAKSAPCLDCGTKFPPYVMDFDHRNSDDKLFVVGKLTAGSKKRLLEEIAKCDVVCSNCHRERTYRRRNKIPLKQPFHPF